MDKEKAGFPLRLYRSRNVLGIVDAETLAFALKAPLFAYSGHAADNQKTAKQSTGRLKMQKTKQGIFRRPV